MRKIRHNLDNFFKTVHNGTFWQCQILIEGIRSGEENKIKCCKLIKAPKSNINGKLHILYYTYLKNIVTKSFKFNL